MGTSLLLINDWLLQWSPSCLSSGNFKPTANWKKVAVHPRLQNSSRAFQMTDGTPRVYPKKLKMWNTQQGYLDVDKRSPEVLTKLGRSIRRKIIHGGAGWISGTWKVSLHYSCRAETKYLVGDTLYIETKMFSLKKQLFLYSARTKNISGLMQIYVRFPNRHAPVDVIWDQVLTFTRVHRNWTRRA